MVLGGGIEGRCARACLLRQPAPARADGGEKPFPSDIKRVAHTHHRQRIGRLGKNTSTTTTTTKKRQEQNDNTTSRWFLFCSSGAAWHRARECVSGGDTVRLTLEWFQDAVCRAVPVQGCVKCMVFVVGAGGVWEERGSMDSCVKRVLLHPPHPGSSRVTS